jgi:hypothetical protein
MTWNWTKSDQPRLMRVKVNKQQGSWGYSQVLDPNMTGFTCFVLRSEKNRSSTRFLNCQQR